jgi:hypothetical protein
MNELDKEEKCLWYETEELEKAREEAIGAYNKYLQKITNENYDNFIEKAKIYGKIQIVENELSLIFDTILGKNEKIPEDLWYKKIYLYDNVIELIKKLDRYELKPLSEGKINKVVKNILSDAYLNLIIDFAKEKMGEVSLARMNDVSLKITKAICKEFGEPKPLNKDKLITIMARLYSTDKLNKQEIENIARAICENDKELREG